LLATELIIPLWFQIKNDEQRTKQTSVN